MTEPKHAAPTLVRMWSDGFREEGPSAWVEWQGNGFTLDPRHPMALALEPHRGLQLLTIASTEELVWTVWQTATGRSAWPSQDPYRFREQMFVSCRPYVNVVRESLISDEYWTQLWLEAEKRHKESQ